MGCQHQKPWFSLLQHNASPLKNSLPSGYQMASHWLVFPEWLTTLSISPSTALLYASDGKETDLKGSVLGPFLKIKEWVNPCAHHCMEIHWSTDIRLWLVPWCSWQMVASRTRMGFGMASQAQSFHIHLGGWHPALLLFWLLVHTFFFFLWTSSAPIAIKNSSPWNWGLVQQVKLPPTMLTSQILLLWVVASLVMHLGKQKMAKVPVPLHSN